MKCPTCGHDPDDIQQKRAAVSRWSQMTKEEKSAEMSRIRRKGVRNTKRTARRSNGRGERPVVQPTKPENRKRERRVNEK